MYLIFVGLDRKGDFNSESMSASNQPTIIGKERRLGLNHEIELQRTLGVDNP